MSFSCFTIMDVSSYPFCLSYNPALLFHTHDAIRFTVAFGMTFLTPTIFYGYFIYDLFFFHNLKIYMSPTPYLAMPLAHFTLLGYVTQKTD